MTLRLVLLLWFAVTPALAQKLTVYAYRKSDGTILSHAPAATDSYNPSGITTDGTRAVIWLPGAAPNGFLDSDGGYRYKVQAGAVVPLSVPDVKDASVAKLLKQYETIVSSLVAVERALQIHPGNAKLTARRDALINQEASKWSDIVSQ